MVKIVILSLFGLVLAGCASTQLNYNTLELASTVGDLQTRQILYNLSEFIDNPYSLPAHVDLSIGSASTNNSITPSIGGPLSEATSAVSQVTRTISAMPSTSTQIQNTSGLASPTASVTGGDAWAQSWTYSPITSSDELRRMRALYQYALGGITNTKFRSAYPLVRKPQNINFDAVRPGSFYCPDLGFTNSTVAKDRLTAQKDVSNATQSKVISANALRNAQKAASEKQTKLNEANDALKLAPADTAKASAVETAKKELEDANNAVASSRNAVSQAADTLKAAQQTKDIADRGTPCKQVDLQDHIADEQFLHRPSCVICLPTEGTFFQGDEAGLVLNPELTNLHGGWLLTELSPLPPDAVSLGHFAGHDLYVRSRDRGKLSDFTLFVLTATEESTGSAASSGAGGGGKSAQGGGGGGGGGKNVLYSAPNASPAAGVLVTPQGAASPIFQQ